MADGSSDLVQDAVYKAWGQSQFKMKAIVGQAMTGADPDEVQAFFESHPCDSMESFCMAKGDHLLVTQQNVGPELPCHDLWDGFLSSNLRKHVEKHITKKHPSGPVYCISSLFRCRGTAQHSAGLGRFGG